MTRAASLLLTALLLAACDGDDLPEKRLPPAPPLPECPNANYRRCDVRERDCQASLAELAACLRDDPPLAALRIDVLTEIEFAEELTAELSATPPKPDLAKAALHDALFIFGLGPQEQPSPTTSALSTVKRLGGLYTPKDKRIVVVDHGVPADSVSNNLVLVHELIHALQDADYDLLHWPSDAPWDSTDVTLARKTIPEGEASFYEYRAAPPFLGLDVEQADFDATFQAHLEHTIGEDFDSTAPVSEAFATFPYAFGALEAYAGWQQGGPRGVDPLWASPPETTQQVMSLVLGLGEPQAQGLPVDEPDLAVDDPLGELKVTGSDTLGAWGLALLLEAAGDKDPDALAVSWRGDRLFAAKSPNGVSTSALWLIELDSEESARAVNDRLRSFTYVDHGTDGKRVYLSGADLMNAQHRLTPAGRRWLSGN